MCQFCAFYRLLAQATSSEWEHTLPRRRSCLPCFVHSCLLIIVWLSVTRPEDVCLTETSFNSKFPLKKLNQFVEIFTSVTWPAIRRLGRRHWDSGSLSCSIAELILMVQHGDLQATLFVGEGFCALGCWAGCYVELRCFWFGLGNPRPSQEFPNIFYQSLKIYYSVQMGVPLWLALLQYLVYSVLKFQKKYRLLF